MSDSGTSSRDYVAAHVSVVLTVAYLLDQNPLEPLIDLIMAEKSDSYADGLRDRYKKGSPHDRPDS